MSLRLAIIYFIAFLLAACSGETIKRTTYGTVQKVEQHCEQEVGKDC